MNMISFANFDSFDKQTGFFPEAETDEKSEDFSSILSNIFVALQTPEPPVKMIAPNEQTGVLNTISSLPEIPVSTPLNDRFVVSEQFGGNDRLAVSEQPGGNVQFNESGKVINPEMPEFVPPLTDSPKFELPKEFTPPPPPLWAQTQAIRQRSSGFKTELKVNNPLPVQINELIQTKTPIKSETPEYFTKPLPDSLFSGAKPEFFINRKTIENIAASPNDDFQDNTVELSEPTNFKPINFEPAEIAPPTNDVSPSTVQPAVKTSDETIRQAEQMPANLLTDEFSVIVEKPEITGIEKPSIPKEIKLPFAEILEPRPETAPKTIEARLQDYYGKLELVAEKPVNFESKPVIPETTPPIIAIGKSPTELPPTDLPPRPEQPNIFLKPKFVGNKLSGFDLTPNEIHSIIGTFEQFIRKSEPKQGPSVTARQEPTVEVDQAASEFQPVQKPDPAKPLGFLDRKNDLSPSIEAPAVEQASVELPKTIILTDSAEKKMTAAKNDFIDNESAAFKTGDQTKPINLKDNSSTLDLGEGDKPKFDLKIKETDDQTVKFDRFIENAAKDQKVEKAVQNQQIEPAKIAEQINPHLLELAALADKKNEKQTMRLRLHPAELGAVDIKIERNSAGTLNAYFRTETEGARQVLTSSLEQLRDSLQNAGWQIGQLEITNGSSSSTFNQHRENQSRQSEPATNYGFSRNSEQPDDSDQNPTNRLLSLLA